MCFIFDTTLRYAYNIYIYIYCGELDCIKSLKQKWFQKYFTGSILADQSLLQCWGTKQGIFNRTDVFKYDNISYSMRTQ